MERRRAYSRRTFFAASGQWRGRGNRSDGISLRRWSDRWTAPTTNDSKKRISKDFHGQLGRPQQGAKRFCPRQNMRDKRPRRRQSKRCFCHTAWRVATIDQWPINADTFLIKSMILA
mmetsp:Transcript_31575/g.72295  ORF Transcript_31575/g.72295 Transcript_31575/m.72295 type:complete len:117 (+) Transcript_31575:212-562(+)